MAGGPGALLLVVTLKTSLSAKRSKELGDPKPWQEFLGHYGVFACIALMQSTFSCAGTLLFLREQSVHPMLFMLTGWFSSLVYSFFTYTLVASFSNVGKAICVLFLVMQISGSDAAYPLAILPKFVSDLSPFLPVTYSVTAVRLVVTLKTSLSAKRSKELGDPKPWQEFLGHYGVFACIALMQSTFSCAGTLLFLREQSVHPMLFMLTGWFSSLVYSFFTYTLVASFSNVGKAICVLFLVMQISGSDAAYPLAILPKFVSDLSPFLPVTYSVTAVRGAIAGIYENDYWIAMGKLALFLVPMLHIGLLLRPSLGKFNAWYSAKVESTKLVG